MKDRSSGTLPAGWVELRLADIAQRITKGTTPTTLGLSFQSSGIPFIKVENLVDSKIDSQTVRAYIDAETHDALRRSQLKTGDVLFSIAGTIGRVALVRESDVPANTNQAIAIISGTDDVLERKYLMYALLSPSAQSQASQRARGGAMSNVSLGDIASIRIPVAPRSTQRRIVSEIEQQFTRLGAAADTLEASSDKLDRLVSTTIIGKCLCSDPGEIQYHPVGSIGSVTLGRQRAPKYHKGPNMRPYLRVANVYEDRIECQDINWMNFTDAEFERYRLTEGDVLLNEGQSIELVGRPAIYRGEAAACCFQNTLIRFRASSDVIPEYALYVFRAWLRAGEFRKMARLTTTMAHLGAERFAAMAFPLRPVASQQNIVKYLDTALSSISHLAEEIKRASDRAARLRQAVLQRAFQGRLTPQEPADAPTQRKRPREVHA